METIKLQVVWKSRAEMSLQKIFRYIAEDSVSNAEKFIDQLIEFGDSLGFLPLKFPICKNKAFALRKMHCAVFHRNYIVIHRIERNQLIIFNIVHASRIR